jgi:CxxC-x17-CxxC domain-containing protein
MDRDRRDDSRGRGRSGFDSDRPMYDAKCSDCGVDCKVPFEPTQGKPVYCRDCYRKHKPRY